MIWTEVKKALNSSLGTADFMPLDQILAKIKNENLNVINDYTAGENIDAGDLVSYHSSTNTVKKATLVSSFGALGANLTTGNAEVATCKMSETLVVVAYYTSNKVYARQIHIDSAGACTYGTASILATLSTTTTRDNGITVCALTSTIILVTFINEDTNTLYSVVGDISGENIVGGTPTQIYANLPIHLYSARISDTKALISFNYSTTPTCSVQVVNVSGTTITFGTPVSVLTPDTVNAIYRMGIARISDTKMIVTGGTYTSPDSTIKAIIANISGTTITLGTQYTIGSFAGGADYDSISNVAVINDNLAVVQVANDILLVQINGDVLSVLWKDSFGSYTTPFEDVSLMVRNNNTLIIGVVPSTINYGGTMVIAKLDVDGVTVIESKTTLNSSSGNGTKRMLALNDYMFFGMMLSPTTYYKPNIYFYDDFFGVALEAGTTNNPVSIQVAGVVSDVLSGLIPAGVYSQNGHNLQFGANSMRLVGVATSPTQLKITNGILDK